MIGAALGALVAMLTQLSKFVLASKTFVSVEGEMVMRNGSVRPAGFKVTALWPETAAAQKVASIKGNLRIVNG